MGSKFDYNTEFISIKSKGLLIIPSKDVSTVCMMAEIKYSNKLFPLDIISSNLARLCT